ncbi:uncharacterized protein BX663DRAFT_513277 [Cokeromyces recurvatus]|uniref:uncharacterized protein n=1 Tax=Cokeromyces recurvatus TaxID=90255 RepID=UPI002220019C|nr:uncharacterized protein BX663DRAFT_513277 [Cokeromyces recurvatus]KAI7901558.1 hypothetical protein BX663DRAFT_513277 [Cokeromyces recurvatus]
MTSQCIWSLLSIKKDLEFIYSSSFERYLNKHSLFQLIHPDEVSLAKKDLSKFIKNSNQYLKGSITRCRIRDLTSLHREFKSWRIVDIIMYVVTDDLVLAFFHHQDNQHLSTSICGEKEDICILHLRENLIKQYQRSPLSIDFNHSRHFHILDNRTRSVLLSWPDEGCTEWNHFIHRLISPGFSCFHCIEQPSRINLLGQQVNSLIIDYGSISFVLERVKKKNKNYHFSKYPTYHIPFNNNHHHKHAASEVLFSNKTHEIVENTVVSLPLKQRSSNNKHHCQNCGTRTSPEWRRGPTGHKTLCNACGLRYSRSVARKERQIANQLKQQQQQQPNNSISSLTLKQIINYTTPF